MGEGGAKFLLGSPTPPAAPQPRPDIFAASIVIELSCRRRAEELRPGELVGFGPGTAALQTPSPARHLPLPLL